jgi:hypothetical protein
MFMVSPTCLEQVGQTMLMLGAAHFCDLLDGALLKTPQVPQWPLFRPHGDQGPALEKSSASSRLGIIPI